jgi:hypothetical protein
MQPRRESRSWHSGCRSVSCSILCYAWVWSLFEGRGRNLKSEQFSFKFKWSWTYSYTALVYDAYLKSGDVYTALGYEAYLKAEVETWKQSSWTLTFNEVGRTAFTAPWYRYLLFLGRPSRLRNRESSPFKWQRVPLMNQSETKIRTDFIWFLLSLAAQAWLASKCAILSITGRGEYSIVISEVISALLSCHTRQATWALAN